MDHRGNKGEDREGKEKEKITVKCCVGGSMSSTVLSAAVYNSLSNLITATTPHTIFGQKDNVQIWIKRQCPNLDKGTFRVFCGLPCFGHVDFHASVDIDVNGKKTGEESFDRIKNTTIICIIILYSEKFRQRDNVVPRLGQCPNLDKGTMSKFR